ncbi:alpha/beta hydrolase [Rhizobiaceae bacterium n13]|uniref:Alpha/beta hydrolase n=1 Tax=Ferirhizobium litorale TaxID=2927786 RepID=A0AAE3QJQ0_9HYPH|nr:alpha/beta hydrolase [Fererhizobium litorale]MDI7864063.1 alpha/beta hydrolase [Fererhizobium litorale]MDI7924454.1 alpha/beta hydrolase [Fererhizobium litorale]
MHMSTVHFTFTGLSAFFLSVFAASAVAAEPLKPFKDELFSSNAVIESRDGGDYEVIDYDEMRDINGRDQVPERRAKGKYVARLKQKPVAEALVLDRGNLELSRVGAATNASFTVIFIHGRGGDRRLGMNDYTFGGNFNRLKNLAVENGGAYYAPSMQGFDDQDVRGIATLIDRAAKLSPGRPVILSCASMGSFICWGIARRPETVAQLKGMVILGGATDPDFKKSAAYKAKLPIWFTHGSRDSVYAAKDQTALYKQLHKTGYPVRFTLFETGSHGTPVRMTDWRSVLNWIIAAR